MSVMLRLANIVETAINPGLALLPAKMDTPAARVQLLATGLQESRFEHRVQLPLRPGMPPGPARGFWQFEKGGGAAGVLRHPASRDLMRSVCAERDCASTPAALWDALSRDDVLAAAAARLLYWTDAAPLPAIGDAQGAWDYYVRNWRPGRPHRNTWDSLYAQAVNEVTGA